MSSHDDREKQIQELLNKISESGKYNETVFSAPGIYFTIYNGRIFEISDDASCSPRGGWFPDIISGPTENENAFLEQIMDELEIDECFFSEVIEDCGEFDDESAMEYFEENDDEESLKIYKKIKRKVKQQTSPFETIEDFVSALGRYGLESDRLYYEWEGDFIDLCDNISETGEERGYYDNIDDEKWIEILSNIDSFKI